jgi:hypothetical protein
MKRIRLSTLLLLVVIAAQAIALVVQEQWRRRSQTELWEISPEFRTDEVDKMFADYIAGRIPYTLRLPIMGRELRVRIVNEMRVTYEGFVPLKELADQPTHFWYTKNGECVIRQYDSDTLFVQIRTKYALSLKRDETGDDEQTLPDSVSR